MQFANFFLTSVVAATLASSALAAGSDSTQPPVKTETTQKCKHGKIWDIKKEKCVAAQSSGLSDDALYTAARELAYDGQYQNALQVLSVASNQNDPRILNYKGFALRKSGHFAEGMSFYKAALDIDPDYILARSYMGQAMISEGDFIGAKQQLIEIAQRGGKDTWAFTALNLALHGQTTTW